MNTDTAAAPHANIDTVTAALGQGLPTLLSHFVVALLLLALGVALSIAVTGYRERELVLHGNAAAGTALAGSVLGLAIPIAALLATSSAVLDILVWGVVAVLLQLITFGIVTLLLGRLRSAIEGGNVAAAMVLAAAQVSVALLNAAVMVPN